MIWILIFLCSVRKSNSMRCVCECVRWTRAVGNARVRASACVCDLRIYGDKSRFTTLTFVAHHRAFTVLTNFYLNRISMNIIILNFTFRAIRFINWIVILQETNLTPPPPPNSMLLLSIKHEAIHSLFVIVCASVCCVKTLTARI